MLKVIYTPLFLVSSDSWQIIAERFQSLIEQGLDMQPMLRLVQDIAASRYVHGLYGKASMHSLCLSQHANFDYGMNMLKVDFADERFVFRYSESPYKPKEWQKDCGRDKGFDTLEHILKRLNWFLE